ncbi:MAG: hypothetical protein KJO19_00355 [Woeseia sp.]|nr:hypothetical protein [Woeseia sp.]
MKGRRNPFIAREGIPFVLLVLAAIALASWFSMNVLAMLLLPVLGWLLLVFRDPRRRIPASPLGIVSPVDGKVIEVGVAPSSLVPGDATRIRLQIDSFGSYTARSPCEGKIMDLRGDLPVGAPARDSRGLWVRTDENQDILLEFFGYRFGLAPRAFLGFGERLGQGQRCAYLRLAKIAEVQLPLDSRALVTVGQRVTAGTDLLARLPHP